MIKRVLLENFGKYRSRHFDLGSVTLFIGENESGKTTIFDAIFDSLCKPKGNSSAGRRLKERYGEDRTSKIIFDGSAVEIDPDEFMNLYAINSGKITLEIPSGGSWIDRVKNELFSGGIDPEEISKDLEREASTRRNLSHMKELERWEGELNTAEKAIKELNEKRREILNSESKMKSSQQELKKIKEKIEEKQKRVEELKQFLHQQQYIRELKEYRSVLDLLSKYGEAKKQIEQLKAFSVDESEEMENLDREEVEVRNDLAVKRGNKSTLERQLQEARRKLVDVENEKGKLGRPYQIAFELKRSLEEKRPAPEKKVRTEWNTLVLVIAGVVFLLSMVPLFFLPIRFSLLSAGAGLIFFILLTLLARRRVTWTDNSSVEEAVKKVKEEWIRRIGDKEGLSAQTYEGLLSELDRRINDYDYIFKQHTEAGEVVKRLEVALQEEERLLREREDSSRNVRERLNYWLGERGVSSKREYSEKVAEYKSLNRALQELHKQIKDKLQYYNLEDETSLKTECELKIGMLDKEISGEKATETEIKARERELSALEEEVENLKKEAERLSLSLSESRGMVRGTLGDIPERIVGYEKKIRSIKEEIERLNLDRRAAGIACELFRKISTDSRMMLGNLAEEISHTLGDILDQQRSIDLEYLDMERATVTDAGGEKRRTDFLSGGTKDAFLLSARFALALKAKSNAQILILDEPFLSMDRRRTENALRLLKRFQEQKGWQIIIFSKDEDMESIGREVFSDTLVHRLNV